MVNLSTLDPSIVLSLTIIGEARGEPIEGQVAVGSVIRNRLTKYNIKYKNYRDVCLEPFQFSCWNKSDPNREYLLGIAEKILIGEVITDYHLKQCQYVAAGIFNWYIKDNTGGSLYYMTKGLFDTKRPSWATFTENERIYGKQIFFNVIPKDNDKVTIT